MRHLTMGICLVLLQGIATAQSLPEQAHGSNFVLVNGAAIGELDLDTAQVRRLTAVERQYQTAFDQAMANDTLTEDELAHRVERLARRRQAGIKAILTPSQYERWARLVAEAPVK